MKYDATNIPSVYDAGRSLADDVMARWMTVIIARVASTEVSAILDLGCGTGRFSAPLARAFGAPVIGVDPSIRMLARARAQQPEPARVRLAAGAGERLPLRAGSVDLVFMSMVFHHFTDPRQVARECRRVARSGGWVLVRTGVRERIPDYPYVPCFPASVPLLRGRLPTLARVVSTFERAGFEAAGADIVTQEVAPSWAAYAERLALGADSVLASLSAVEFAAGMTTLRRHAATGSGAVSEPIDLLAFRRTT